jgi:hypothetical protein
MNTRQLLGQKTVARHGKDDASLTTDSGDTGQLLPVVTVQLCSLKLVLTRGGMLSSVDAPTAPLSAISINADGSVDPAQAASEPR